MLANNLKVAFKSFQRLGLFNLINVAGIAVCFACVLLLAKYLVHETSYDRFHVNSDSLYRVWIHEDHGDGRDFTNISTPIILAPTLAQNFPEIERVVRVDKVNLQVRSGDVPFEEAIHLADPAFFASFSFEWLQGNQEAAFNEINSIVLTPQMAQKYFGNESALGKALELNTGDSFEAFKVVGIVKAPPTGSTLQFQALIPFSDKYYGDRATSWFSVSVETYLQLRPGEDVAALENNVNSLLQRTLGEAYPRNGHYLAHLQPITAIHLDTELPAGMEPLGDPVALLLVASGAVLVLIIVAVNHGTIALGSIAGRTKEVAVRRTIGAGRTNLLQQFCIEAAQPCLVGMLLGLVLAELYLPVFNQLAGMSLTIVFNGELLGLMTGILLLFSLLTGGIPTLVLSRFKPGQLLGNRLYFDSGKSLVIRGLITFQFALAIAMLVSSVAVSLQMRYFDSKDLGFDKENLVVVRIPGGVAEGQQLAERYIQEAGNLPFITGITYASAPPGEGVQRLGYRDDQQRFRQFDAYTVGPDFLSVMGMDLIEGRAFRSGTFDSAQALIVNEAFLRDYGWTSGIGNRLPAANFADLEIIGVVRDAHFSSLVDAVRPTVFALSLAEINKGVSDALSFSSRTPELLIRTDGSPLSSLLPALEATWERIEAGSAFEYYELAIALEALYRQQANFQDIVLSSTSLAVFIAAIGLFAMAVLTTSRRTKEIGVRKVMGGSVMSIVWLLTNHFSRLVLVANLIAWPIAWFAMTRWLENFAYRIDLTPMLFIGSGLIALCIAWVAVGGTAAKAANQKPVLALRYE